MPNKTMLTGVSGNMCSLHKVISTSPGVDHLFSRDTLAFLLGVRI